LESEKKAQVMPTYTFLNKNTNEYEDHWMKIAELDFFKESNPHLEKVIMDAPGCCDPFVAGRMKPADGFRDLLKNMKKKHRGSTINDF
jgi:hypothetical protein